MKDKPVATGRVERWLIPVLLIAFCLGAFYVSTTFTRMPPILKRGIQPSDFPQLLLAAIMVMVVAMAWFDPVRVAGRMRGTVWGTLALFALFAGLTAIDLFLALGIFAAALAAMWGERKAHILALVGIAVPLVIFFMFDRVFEIRFPRGILTGLWYG